MNADTYMQKRALRLVYYFTRKASMVSSEALGWRKKEDVAETRCSQIGCWVPPSLDKIESVSVGSLSFELLFDFASASSSSHLGVFFLYLLMKYFILFASTVGCRGGFSLWSFPRMVIVFD